jgi:hypothetical protein
MPRSTMKTFKIRIKCSTHNAAVVPAGDALHWFENEDGTYELDFGDLYCTGGTGEHEFRVEVLKEA